MLEIISDVFWDTLKTVPLLLVIYAGIELAEYRFGDRIVTAVKKAGAWGPLAGAIAGIFPQCGFSVIATALYTQKLLTTGTLLAVYLSTSDEAIPIIMSQPGKIGIILPLIATKLVIALVAGYAIDIIFRKRNKAVLAHIADYSRGNDDKSHHHESALDETACCGHSADPESKKFDQSEIFVHPLVHTLKIAIFIFAASLTIQFFFGYAGTGAIAGFLAFNKNFAPFIAALAGLIPNCAASVAITEFYLKGLITYGAAIAGLCSSAGLGILVLIRDNKDRGDIARIILLLLGTSIIAGFLINFLQ